MKYSTSMLTAAGVTLIILLSFSSCSRLPEQIKYIPGEAAAVATINGKSLVKKIAWNETGDSSVLKDIERSAGPSVGTLLEHPRETGVDILSPFYIFYLPDKRFGNGYTAVVGALSDANTFGSLMRKRYGSVPVKNEGDISSMLLAENNLIAWNKRIVIFMYPSQGSLNTAELKQMFTGNDSAIARLGSDSAGFRQLLGQADTTFDTASLYAEMHRLFTLSKDNSIEGNDKFTALQRQQADMSVWVNMEEVYKSAPSRSTLLRADYFDKTYFTCTVNFNNGAIDMEGRSYSNNALAQIAQRYSGSAINMHYVRSIPSSNVVALMAIAFHPDYIKALLNYYGLDGVVNLALSSQGLSLDTLLHAFTGDMVAAATDLKPTGGSTNAAGDSSAGTSVNWLFAAGLNKSPVLDRLLQMADSNNLVKKEGDDYMIQMPGNPIVLQKTDKLLTIASSGEMADKFSKGNGGDAPDAAILGHFEGRPFAFYLNIRQLMQLIPDDTANAAGNQGLAPFKGLFSDFYVAGGELSHGATVFNMQLSFVNKDENSLTQLIRAGTEVYRQESGK